MAAFFYGITVELWVIWCYTFYDLRKKKVQLWKTDYFPIKD